MNFCACKNSTGAVCAQALLLWLASTYTNTHTAQRSHYLFCTWRPRNSFSAAAASAVLIPHAARNCCFIQQYQVLMRSYRHLRRRCKTLLCKRAPAVASGSFRSLILQRRMSVCFCIKFRRTGNDFGGWAASPGTYLAAERAGHPFCESLSVAGVEWLLVKKWPSKLGIE